MAGAILRESWATRGREKSITETSKRVVVTGAAGALGAAVARAFMGAGAKLALIDRVADPKDSLKDVGPPNFFMGGIDLTDPAHAQRAMDAAVSGLGGIDVLVNIAGGFRWETIADRKLET